MKQLKNKYPNPISILPDFISSKTSKFSVLNVVNPPSRPVVMNNFMICGTLSTLFNIKPKKHPIKKQPIIFALKVPIIVFARYFEDKRVKPYLKMAPIPPPIKTEINFNNILEPYTIWY